ncbi:hypothetical protein GHT06_014413 [Daphnia sinensis]|uniref:Uncharacterized protein n=1 Tax=Daphnia sinensis TaxID=1820382 RepID=A0AAD5LCX3_9CRUS|nr:hypothetical protein GHT06_014413 [Daphnia sinensis]
MESKHENLFQVFIVAALVVAAVGSQPYFEKYYPLKEQKHYSYQVPYFLPNFNRFHDDDEYDFRHNYVHPFLQNKPVLPPQKTWPRFMIFFAKLRKILHV